MIISVTERGTFRRCKRMWDYSSRSRQNLQPIINRPALSIGRVYHQAQAAWLQDWTDTDGKPVRNLMWYGMEFANQEVDRVKADYLAAVGAPIAPTEMELSYSSMAMVVSMCENYEARWHTPLPDGFRSLSPEQTIAVPIPGTKHCPNCHFYVLDEAETVCALCDTSPLHWHYLEGTLDGLIEDESGRLYVLERKTYGSRPNELALSMSDQFLAYLWLLHVTFGAEREIAGLAYDGAWKREQPPRGKSLEDMFYRTILIRPPSEIHEMENQLRYEAVEMAGSPAIYRNVRWEGCYDCEFVKLCNAQSRHEDVPFMIRNFYTQRPDDKQMLGIENDLGVSAGAAV